MNQYLKYITTLALLIMSSCQGLLDKEPQNKISLEETFQDFASAKVALTGAYAQLFATEYYSGNRMLYPDIAAGNTKYSKISNVRLYDAYNFNANSDDSEMNATYTYLYSVLNNVNNIIYYAPGIPNGTKAGRDRLVAEATALRALIHFDLLLLFAQPYQFTADASHAGIILNLQPILIDQSVRPRATVAECYDRIEKDLTDAIELFESTTPIFAAGSVSNYLNINSAKALLARLNLYKGDWQQAYDYASEVIGTNSFPLYTNAGYVNAWTQKNTSESIFEISIPNAFTGVGLGNYYDITGANVPASATQAAATNDLLELYTPSDVRNESNFYYQQSVAGVRYSFCRKYPTGGVQSTGVKVIRISEMYLVRAEAAAELGSTATALADLNTIVKRADTQASPITATEKNMLIERILLERRKELNYEGFLLFDLSRRQKKLTRLDCNAITCGLEYPSNYFVLPIPSSTILVNPLMKQNPGY